MPILSIRHVTRYRYRNPVALGEHRMMLRPRENHDQRILSHTLAISPVPARETLVHDVFGNSVGVATFTGRTRELVFDSHTVLEHEPSPAFAGMDGEIAPYSGAMPFDYAAEDLPDLLPSMQRLHADPDGEIDAWARKFVRPFGKTPLQKLLSEMTQAIYADFRYAKRLEGKAQDPLATLAQKTGSCRDFAVLMMEAVRSLGLAARFVSGYIYSPGLYAVGSDQGERVGGGHTHAWVRVFLPACGWVEFDPTNGIVGNADLIRVAIARDPRQAVPLYGSWIGNAGDFLDMDVEVDCRVETATPTQPQPLRVVRTAP